MLEKLAQELAVKGFYACIRREPSGWACTLFTSKLKANPIGNGASAEAAMIAAKADLDKLAADPRYKV